MKKLLFAAVILVLLGYGIARPQGGSGARLKNFPQSQIQPQSTDPISVETNESIRTVYETLAAMNGLNILFYPDVLLDKSVSFKVENVDPLDAIQRLSNQTKNFVEVLDSKTIIVGPDTQIARRMLETHVLATVYLANVNTSTDIGAIISALRTQANLSNIAQSSNPWAILMRGTPDRIAIARQIVRDADKPKSGEARGSSAPTRDIAFDVLGNLLVSDGGVVRKVGPARSTLRPTSSGLVSFNTNDRSRATYETLARTAGVNLLFDADFRDGGPIPFHVDNVDIYDALDYFGLQTANYWEVLNSNTILIAPDNQTARRNYENMVLKTYYLPALATSQRLTETITALRTLLNASFIAQSTQAKAILVRDTATKVALSDEIVNAMATFNGQTPSQSSAVSIGSVNRPGIRPPGASASSPLELKIKTPISIDIDQSVRTSYSTLASLAGIEVKFDDSLIDTPPRPLKLSNVDILDALDLLALQTRTFWQIVDSKTIVVAPDNQTNRRKLEPIVEKTFTLKNANSSVGITEIVTALRTIINASQLESRDNTIVMRDTAGKIAIAEKIVADFDKPAR